LKILLTLLDAQVSIFASWDRQDSTFASFEIATFCFSLDQQASNFYDIQVSQHIS